MACNLLVLHIHLDKSCAMCFPPNRKFLNIKQSTKIGNKKAGKSQPLKEIQSTGLSISIAFTKIKEVTEAKFLGV